MEKLSFSAARISTFLCGSLVSLFGIMIALNSCAGQKSELRTSQYEFQFEEKTYLIRSISSKDKSQSYNLLVGRQLEAADYNKDQLIDSVTYGQMSVDDAQKIYNYGLSSAMQENKVLISGLADSQDELNSKEKSIFARNNLAAWCIVPFDSHERNATERAKMLKDLGFTKFAYDWRSEDLPFLSQEIQVMRENDIQLIAVWFWIDGASDMLLDDNNRYILETLKAQNVKTDLWVSFNDRFFENLSNSELLEKTSKAIREIYAYAKDIGCGISLYNHGGWFGNPINQIRIIEYLGKRDIGIIYNFHHAHHQIDDFPKLLEEMKPYLKTVNLNGMRLAGPKIMPIGDGDRELSMLKALKASGFKGNIGIIGHTEDEDAGEVLKQNILGLQKLLKEMGDTNALKTYNHNFSGK